jgi:uncharacterized repeat protein (TIGR01451 family)
VLTTLALLAPLATTIAQAPQPQTSPVTVALSQFLVKTTTENNKTTERFEDFQTVFPGDVIEYRLVLANTGNEAVSGAGATLPIPNATFYLDKTASSLAGVTLLASLDGKNFRLPPLKRQVVRDGKTVEEVVKPNEYRALRWRLQNKLEAGAKLEFKARVQVR